MMKMMHSATAWQPVLLPSHFFVVEFDVFHLPISHWHCSGHMGDHITTGSAKCPCGQANHRRGRIAYVYHPSLQLLIPRPDITGLNGRVMVIHHVYWMCFHVHNHPEAHSRVNALFQRQHCPPKMRYIARMELNGQ